MKKYNAVIIGCGKIGALYDIENDLILTHAKGYYLSDIINLKFVIDVDKSVAVKVSKKYNCDYKLDYKDIDYKEIDIVSICTPTEFHFEILSYFYKIQYTKIILLEKPVVESEEEITLIESFSKKFLDNIFINYIRAYDKDYRDIFEKLKNNNYSNIEYIEVKYFGEFEHNAVHAFNLINRLFSVTPIIKYSDNLTVILNYNGIDIIFRSLATKYVNYDISIYTNTHKLCFDHLGYKVNVYKNKLSTKFENTYELDLVFSKDILDGYILDLIDIIFDRSAYKPTIYDGIKDLKLIKEIKNVGNHTC